MTYAFRKFIPETDDVLFHDWLAQPHIAGWWNDAETELKLVHEDLDNAAIGMWIVEHNGTPFAFIQDYNAHHWPMPQYSDQPAEARAIDTFLGDPAFLGQGHATGYIAQRLKDLRRHFPVIVTDPDPNNTRAINAYARAGFRPTKITPSEDGDPVQVMVHP